MPDQIVPGSETQRRFLLGDSSLFSPVGVYPDFSFARNYIFPRWGFTVLLLSWGTTCIRFIATEGDVSTEPGDPYLSRIPDFFSNMYVFPVVHPHFLSTYVMPVMQYTITIVCGSLV